MKFNQQLCFHIIIVMIFLMIPSLAAQSNSEETKISLLILTGGHEFERQAFFEMFDSYSDIAYQEIVHPAANEIYLNGMAEKADILLFYDMMQEISDEQKTAMAALLSRGKPCLFLHHSLASYQNWPEFEHIIGGKYILAEDSTTAGSTYRHDVEFAIRVVQDGENAITRDIPDFTIYDEVYGNFSMLPQCKPLLATGHPESGPVIAWINSYGRSTIIYIQPGHDHHSYENPHYRRLVHQAIIWLAGKL